MIELARTRLADLPDAAVVLADITDFSLGRVFDGAACPVNTLLHLSPHDLARHLTAMARHLRPGSRYLIQLAVFDAENPQSAPRPSRWQVTRGDTTVKITWTTASVEPSSERLLQRSRIEFISGPRAGEVLEETHEMTAWTPERWRALVEASLFTYTAIYDGDEDDRPRVPEGSTGLMLWHELRL